MTRGGFACDGTWSYGLTGILFPKYIHAEFSRTERYWVSSIHHPPALSSSSSHPFLFQLQNPIPLNYKPFSVPSVRANLSASSAPSLLGTNQYPKLLLIACSLALLSPILSQAPLPLRRVFWVSVCPCPKGAKTPASGETGDSGEVGAVRVAFGGAVHG